MDSLPTMIRGLSLALRWINAARRRAEQDSRPVIALL